MRHLCFLGKLFSGVSSKLIYGSMGSSYCKKNCGKYEINVAEIIQKRLEKLAIFFVWLVKFGKKTVFYVVIRRGKNA